MVIGNPPYVEYNEKRFIYKLDIDNFKTLTCSNLHAFIAERCTYISRLNSYVGLIVPLPSIITTRMLPLQRIIKPQNCNSIWISSYDERPSNLFNGVDQRLIIEIISKGTLPNIYTTGITRWQSEHRGWLFDSINYAHQDLSSMRKTDSILKMKSHIECSILDKFYKNQPLILNKNLSRHITENTFFYRSAGGRYWKIFLDKDFGTGNSSEKHASINGISNYSVISILSSDVFWWYYSSHYDMFNLGDYQIFGFRYTITDMIANDILNNLGIQYVQSLEDNSITKQVKTNHGIVTQKQYYARKSKTIIIEIDKALAKHYGFTEEELDFIINYDI